VSAAAGAGQSHVPGVSVDNSVILEAVAAHGGVGRRRTAPCGIKAANPLGELVGN